MHIGLTKRLRSAVEKIAGRVAQAVLGAMGVDLPTTARAFEELERRLVAAAAANVVAPAMEAVLRELHESKEFVQACLDQARLARGITPHSRKAVKVRLLCGQTITVATTYAMVVREKRPGPRRGVGRHGPDGRGSFPVLAQLGVFVHATPALHSDVAWSSAALGSYAEAQSALSRRGIDLHVNAIRLLTERFADCAIEARGQPMVGPSRPLAGKRVVVAIDGGRLRVRAEKPGRKRASGHHGYDAPWREPKLLAVYTIDARGCQDGAFLFYEATLGDYDKAFDLFVRWLTAFGLAEAQEVIFAADGSAHIWDRVPGAVRALQVPSDRVRLVVDFWHAAQHVSAAANLLPKLTPYERTLRASTWKRWLKEGRPEEIAAEIELRARGSRGEARRALDNHAAYFRNNAGRMAYAELRRQGLPLGTGVVESAVRRVVNLRIKGSGIFWTEENAERMLVLRSRLKARRWRDLEDAVFARAGDLQGGALRAHKDRHPPPPTSPTDQAA